MSAQGSHFPFVSVGKGGGGDRTVVEGVRLFDFRKSKTKYEVRVEIFGKDLHPSLLWVL